MPNNHRYRHLFQAVAALLALGLLAGACGDSSDQAGTTTTTSTTAPSAAEADPGEGTDEDECRQVEHEMGTACVPVDPQRIVVLDALTALPTLLDAGAPVVASLGVYGVGDPFPDYFDPQATAGIEVLGGMQEPNLEAIAAARPDLLIVSVLLADSIYQQLEAIAPTVVIPYAYYTPGWRDAVRLVGEAAGVADAVEVDLDQLDQLIAETRAALEDRGPLTLSRVDLWQGTALYYRFDCVWFGELLRSVGVDQPDVQKAECTPGDYASTIAYPSLEQLDVLDADAIVAYQQQSTGEDVGADPLDALTVSPVWNALPAVKAGRVHVLGDAWGIGGSVASARVILEDLVGVVFTGEVG